MYLFSEVVTFLSSNKMKNEGTKKKKKILIIISTDGKIASGLLFHVHVRPRAQDYRHLLRNLIYTTKQICNVAFNLQKSITHY